ncbi:hypothetical protein B4U37_17795 [Sutcliffiella horikoshii]|uniref:Glucosamine inositolphosphorylceramide transferase 1 N-terminal domain-containing protein n=1 Tax=Sutcliffiella horikoshii TaxID=79883 RepID=A0ABN4ZH41_9BACI|nr:hypothetical protein [Sutcliffiella horikoshii]ART77768.1 hypothetical protein B4U37_17795 [Sutcliffiella horikoshii]
MINRRRLRFAITVKGNSLEQWKINCINHLMEMPEVELALIIEYQSMPMNRDHSALFLAYHSVVQMRSEILKKVATIDHFSPFPKVRCSNLWNHQSNFSIEELSLLKQTDLDFILHLGEESMEGEVLELATYGVWAFSHGNPTCFTGLPGGWWEVMNNLPVTEVGLYRISKETNERSFWKIGCLATVSESYRKTKEILCQTTLTWPSQVCKEILRNPGHCPDEIEPLSLKHADIEMLSSTKKTANFILASWKRKAQKLYRKLFCYEYWNIGIVNKPIHFFLTDHNPSIDWIVERKDCYYADPFGMRGKDGIQILMEEVDHRVVKGYISGVIMKEGPSIKEQQTWNHSVLKLKSHMSYPYLVEYEGETYCVPETSEAKEVAVYKIINGQLEKEKIILKNFAAVDSTIIHHDGYWWLFCTRADSSPQSDNSELHIFYAKELFGEWSPHLANPVKVDVRSSRPAGTPFLYEDVLIRPAQDCSKTYGGRIILNKITNLTIEEFEEVAISPIEPREDSLYPDGVHTISTVGDITIFDGKRFDYSLLHFFRKLYKFMPVREAG